MCSVILKISAYKLLWQKKMEKEKLFDVLVTAEIFLCILHPAKTTSMTHDTNPVSSDIYNSSMTD